MEESNMEWEALIPLIAQVGIPLAEKIWQKAVSGKDVTQADWDELNAIEAETPQTHLEAIRVALSLAADDPKITALAQLIK